MRVITTVPFSALPGYNGIFADLLEHPDRVAGLFSWDFRRADDWRRVADTRRTANRAALAEVLVEQNRSFGAGEQTLAAAESISHDTTYVVTTGQQLSLYGGSLFYFYKTITAIRLARTLSESLGVSVVPVFWMEGEDHDLPEVDHVYMPGEELQRFQLDGVAPGRQPVGGRALPDSIAELQAKVAPLLPETEFTRDLLDRLGAAYAPGRTWVGAFGRLWAGLFPGLVLLNPSDPRIKALAAPVFRREVQRSGEIVQAAARRDEEIVAKGYELQVRTGYPNFFWLVDGERRGVEYSEGRFRIAEGGEDITGHLDSYSHYSPKVLLRPVTQDFLLPNLATVLGPGEVAYFSQAEALFAAHGVVPSIAYPRAAATIVERPAARLLESAAVAFETLAEGPAAIFDKVKPEHPEERLFDQATAAIEAFSTSLDSIAAGLDPTLIGAVVTAREKISYQLTHLRGKFSRARYQREEVLSRRIEGACRQCFPYGEPQERVIAGIYFLAKYGPRFLDELRDTLEIGGEKHQVVAVD